MPEDQSLPPHTAGVDEVGRGPLAGPVVAAAVILDPVRPIAGLMDSKKLSPARRAVLADIIRAEALAWSLGQAEVEEIDRLNILRASHLAMQRAVAGLDRTPELVLVDGHLTPDFGCRARAVVGGDARVAAISAASIIAKVARDRQMEVLSLSYPGYGLERHKGYPTRAHRAALTALGPSAIHRRSFAPVQAAVRAAARASMQAAGAQATGAAAGEPGAAS